MGLPNEILIFIIEATEPADIESFSTCCKLMYSLAKDRLEEHKKKKSLFSTILVEDYFLPFPQPIPSEKYGKPDTYLKPFFSDERNRLYPKSMVINLDRDEIRSEMIDYDGSHGARISAINRLYEFEHQLKPRMAEVQNIIALEVGGIEVEDWGKSVKAGHPVATFLLLLALLPSLEKFSLELFGNWDRAESANHSKIMRLMIEAAFGRKENGLSFGGRLSECTVEGNYCDDIVEVADLLPFLMMLPKMQRIQGNNLDIVEHSWPYTDGMSPVVDLDLHGVMDSVTISSYVRGIRELKRFRYHYDEFLVGGWEPREMVATLKQFAFRSLVHLDLTTHSTGTGIRFDSSTGIGSLRSFEVLETVRLHHIVLLREVQPADSADIVNSARRLFRGQKLINFLPSSIRIFQLDDAVKGRPKGKPVLDTFKGLPEHRPERLPNLELILLDAGDEINNQIETICKNSGVQMRLIKDNSPFPDLSKICA